MTIGALEEIAEVNPRLVEVYMGLQTFSWEVREVIAVIRAGLRASGSSVTVDDVLNEIGLSGAVDVALQAMEVAFRDDSGKYKAAVEPILASDSKSETTSSLARLWAWIRSQFGG